MSWNWKLGESLLRNIIIYSDVATEQMANLFVLILFQNWKTEIQKNMLTLCYRYKMSGMYIRPVAPLGNEHSDWNHADEMGGALD